MPCTESPHVRAPGLLGWERSLLRDCPTSALGDVGNFPVSADNATAAARFVLGLKALHNFWYDLGKYALGRAIEDEPELYVAYAFRALCDAQLIWNLEDVNGAMAVLQAAQQRPGFPGRMSEREQVRSAWLLASPAQSPPPVAHGRAHARARSVTLTPCSR